MSHILPRAPRSAGVLLVRLAALSICLGSPLRAQTTAVGTVSPVQTATLTFTTAGQPGNIAVLTQGAIGLDFNFVAGGTCSTTTTYAADDSCTVEYTFEPTFPGQRLGDIEI